MINEIINWILNNFFVVIILLILLLLLISDLRSRYSDDSIEKKRILQSQGGVPDFNAIRGREHKNSIKVKRASLSDDSYKRR